ncbi:MAG: 7-cyano-7-deazaguanine synthase QueC, partial [Elusimicrobiaceae bacterium]|nr:7-cyano-7-deazaguanine synthase QueC [Elusimicrobiaceae bacterium]
EISLPPQQMDTLDEAPVVTQEEQAADSHENLPEISAPISQPQPAQPLQPEQETPSPTAEQPEKKKRKQLEKTRSRLKGFISEIVRSVKEEKEEIEESLRQAATGQKRTYELKSDDPMDALLKKSSGSDLAVRKSAPAFAKKTEGPSAGTGFDLNPQPTKATGKLGQNKKAIVLFSGGLDSTTCLYWALAQGYTCEALTVSYGQRHLREVVSAQAISRRLGIKHHLIDLNLPWLAASSLVDASQPLPDIAVEKISQNGIPSTYVPGRNLMFMAIAGSLLDTVEADAIIAGPNAVDFSGYPDCTPAFFKAAAEALNRGTRRGVSEGIEVLAPLMRMSKADIVTLAAQLKVPLELTWSCYAGGEKPCGKCDSCKLRAKGFADAGVHDPALD